MDYGGAKFYGMRKSKVVFHIGKFRFGMNGMIYRRFQCLFLAKTNDGIGNVYKIGGQGGSMWQGN